MNYEQYDQKYIWHPFTHLKYQKKHIIITKAKGIYLYTQEGHKIIDATGSWWVNVHGHTHPYISRKIKKQLDIMEHCMFSGLTHVPAIELAKKLAAIVPVKNGKIFYSDNGSTAVEVGIKMALQYFYNIGKKNKNKIIALRGGYHGDTFGGMSVAERNVFNVPFNKNLFKPYFIDVPTDDNFEQVKKQFLKYIKKNNVAAFIFEPLVQGAAGMIMYSEKYLDELISISQKHHVITIADEVFTGFGKTGKLFACNYLKNKPDILCLSKGLTGGFLPLGVSIAAQKIFQAFVSDDKSKTFYHGHSFTANPLMCTAALANIEWIECSDYIKKIQQIEQWHQTFAASVQSHPFVKEVRVKGIIFALEIKTREHTHYLNGLASIIEKYFLKKNILLRPLGNILYLVPPVVIKKRELKYIYDAIKDFLNDLSTSNFS